MSQVWDGKNFWIWYVEKTLDGNPQTIINKAKDLGLEGLIIKSHDGSAIWSQFRTYVHVFKQAGLKIGAWGYCYPDNIDSQVTAIEDAIQAGADYYIFDIETEFEGKQQQALQLAQAVRSKFPNFPLGYAPFPFPSAHPNYPYKELSTVCNFVAPQVYWMELAPMVWDCIKQTHEELQPFGLPVAPIGQTYVSNYNNQTWTPSATDYPAFEKTCHELGITGVSFWDMQEAQDFMLEGVKTMSFPVQESNGNITVSGNVVLTNSSYYVVEQDQNVSDWAKTSFEKAIQIGIFHGDEKGNYNPHDVVTKEMLSVVLDNSGLLDEIKKIKGV